MTILDRPPPEWKRPPIPCKVKLQVLLNQDGRSTICKERLGRIEDTHFDHRPALSARKFDTKAWDTIPPANDPGHIEAITIAQHDIRTNGPGGTSRITTRGSDTGNRAKDRAVIAKQAEHLANMTAKAKARPSIKKIGPKIRNRSSFPAGRKFQSRKSA
jgi:hypothetical protein